jgi:hypothetical protein
VRIDGVLMSRRVTDPSHFLSRDELIIQRAAWIDTMTPGPRRRPRSPVLPVLSFAQIRALIIKLPKRIAARIETSRACWFWTGGRTKGYGRVWYLGRQRQVHAVVYECCIGPVPVGSVFDHLCRVRHCVNPFHVEPVTTQVNVLRGYSAAAAHARRTHCAEGHPLVRVGSQRICLTCAPSSPSRPTLYPPCACGCGRPLVPHVTARRDARYLPFHKPRAAGN